MMTKTDAREFINDLFLEQALAIGGIVALHPTDDAVVWGLVRNLDSIRGRALRRIDGASGGTTSVDLTPHSAIEDFILSLRRT